MRLTSQQIFVVGCGHSGTTLMASLLGRHPDVLAIGDETRIFYKSKEFVYGAVTQWDVFAQQFGRSAFVEKTPRHVRRMSRIFELLPDARIVYMAREPRDNVASLYERYQDLNRSLRRYVLDNNAAIPFIHDPRVLVCRYDDLVQAPKEMLAAVFTHCAIASDVDVMNQEDTTYRHWISKGGNRSRRGTEVSKPIYDGRGRWRRALDNEQEKWILSETEELAALLGFSDSSF